MFASGAFGVLSVPGGLVLFGDIYFTSIGRFYHID